MKKYDDFNIVSLVEFHLASKVFHWQTKQYAMHIATGGFYESMDVLIDTFVETIQSKYGRVQISRDLKIPNLSEFKGLDELMKNYILPFETFLLKDLVKQLNKEVDTDLFNLRDEMLSELNKLKYLLTLK